VQVAASAAAAAVAAELAQAQTAKARVEKQRAAEAHMEKLVAESSAKVERCRLTLSTPR
jgi:hypothetical protein